MRDAGGGGRACVRRRRPWQAELEAAFPFELTGDQSAPSRGERRPRTAKPMDRLLVGDSGFGRPRSRARRVQRSWTKTSRAPGPDDPMLAAQHFETIRERSRRFPRSSRWFALQDRRGNARRLSALAAGEVDLVVGRTGCFRSTSPSRISGCSSSTKNSASASREGSGEADAIGSTFCP